jgi:hypothetical protein
MTDKETDMPDQPTTDIHHTERTSPTEVTIYTINDHGSTATPVPGGFTEDELVD